MTLHVKCYGTLGEILDELVRFLPLLELRGTEAGAWIRRHELFISATSSKVLVTSRGEEDVAMTMPGDGLKMPSGPR